MLGIWALTSQRSPNDIPGLDLPLVSLACRVFRESLDMRSLQVNKCRASSEELMEEFRTTEFS